MRIDAKLIFHVFQTCALFTMTIAILTGHTMFGLSYSSSCLLCSVLWLTSLALELNGLIADYVDTRKQRRLKITIACGTAASILALSPLAAPLQTAIALAILYGWIMIFLKAADTHAQYRKVERGLVPKDTWLDPPSDVFQPGDVIGTTGVWWEPHHQAFAHCELISYAPALSLISNKAMSKQEWEQYLKSHEGQLLCASSCSMEYGTYLHSCEDVLQNCLKQTHLKEGHERWFCARLTEAGHRDLEATWGKNWQERLTELVIEKTVRNKFTRRVETLRRQKLISSIPFISPRLKDYLCDLLRASGYNWCKMLFADAEGLVSSVRKVSPKLAWLVFGETSSDESDLCSTHVISTILEDLRLSARVKQDHRRNFTPFGFGNPVLPVEVILLKSERGEPYYRLLDLDDKLEYEANKRKSVHRANVMLLPKAKNRQLAG